MGAIQTNSFRQRFSITRRKLLGSMFVGAGTLLTGCQLKSIGKRAKHKGSLLLDRIPSYQPGLMDAIQFPLIEALHGRRSRRFALGNSIPDGPLAFTSSHDPLPLGELEQMLLLTTVAGNTG